MLFILRNPRGATAAAQPAVGRRSRRRAESGTGFTILEIIFAVVMLSVIYAIALPAIARTRLSASVHNARHVVVSTLGLARATAIRFGRPVQLHLDSEAGRIWLEADTALVGSGDPPVILGWFDFGKELSVRLESNRQTLCFNGRGIGTIGEDCPRVGALIVLSREDRTDTVRVSPTGRVLR